MAYQKKTLDGLLDLAVAPTGRPVDVGRIRITDKHVFEQFLQMTMGAATAFFAEQAAGADPAEPAPIPQGWVEDDGQLTIRVGGDWQQVLSVPAGGWRMLTDKEFEKKLTRMAALEDARGGEVLTRIADVFRDQAVVAQQRNAEVDVFVLGALERGAPVAMVFDRSMDSLLTLKSLCSSAVAAGAEPAANAWLADQNEAFFVLGMGTTDAARFTRSAPNDTALLGYALPELAAQLDDIRRDTVVLGATGDPGLNAAIGEVWEEQGGRSL